MSSLLREARSLSSDHRRAFLAAFLGWMLDGFDYTILTFVLVDIQRSFTVDNTLAGALGTVTLMFRLIGGEWAAGMPLALEHLPDHLRGVAAGVLQGAFTWGFIVSACVFQFIYPLMHGRP